MLKPLMLLCGHLGGKTCLTSLVATTCPICRDDILPTTPLQVDVTLNYLTSKLDVICTNIGCQWSGKYDMAEHHSNHCPRVKVT